MKAAMSDSKTPLPFRDDPTAAAQEETDQLKRSQMEVLEKISGLSQEEIDECFAMYADEPFTHYVPRDIDMKQVVNTNRALVHAQKYGDRLLVTSVIDNLLKGAAGQAVENMNIMFGIPETTGLKLKAVGF